MKVSRSLWPLAVFVCLGLSLSTLLIVAAAIMALTSTFVFRKIGGRFKLDAEEDMKSCYGIAAVSNALEALKKQREVRLRHLERSRLAVSKSEVMDFLKKNGFRSQHDVSLNAPKRTALGLRCTYPLHLGFTLATWGAE
eukprot:s8189_g1.t1